MLTEQVAEAIEEMITGGRFAADSHLPREKDLMRQFGVSRTVVREATKRLAAQGVVAIHYGRGVRERGGAESEQIRDALARVMRNNASMLDDLLAVQRLL